MPISRTFTTGPKFSESHHKYINKTLNKIRATITEYSRNTNQYTMTSSDNSVEIHSTFQRIMGFLKRNKLQAASKAQPNLSTPGGQDQNTDPNTQQYTLTMQLKAAEKELKNSITDSSPSIYNERTAAEEDKKDTGRTCATIDFQNTPKLTQQMIINLFKKEVELNSSIPDIKFKNIQENPTHIDMQISEIPKSEEDYNKILEALKNIAKKYNALIETIDYNNPIKTKYNQTR